MIASLAAAPAHAAWPVNGTALCNALGTQQAHTMAPDGTGGTIVAWEDYRNRTSDIFAQRVDGTGAVVWTLNGVGVGNFAGEQHSPSITPDGSGGAIIAWEDYRSGRSDIYAQRVNSAGVAQWTAGGVAVCIAIYDQLAPSVASDGSGGAIIAWYDIRDSLQNDIYAQRLDASGAPQWAANGVLVSGSIGDQIMPVLLADGVGGAIATWEDGRKLFEFDLYAQRLSPTGTLLWSVEGVAVSAAAGNQFSPRLISDGSTGMIAAWEDGRDSDTHIYAQRVNAAGAVQWTADGAPVAVALDSQTSPTIATDGASGAIIAWEDRRATVNPLNPKYDVFVQRISNVGAPLWALNGIPAVIDTFKANVAQYAPAIASDGASGAIVAWCDQRDLTTSGVDLYAQHLDGTGAYLWDDTTAVRLAVTARSQNQPAAISDGAGGAVFAWQDFRNNGDIDLYAARLTGSGGLNITTGVPSSPIAGFEMFAPAPNPAVRGTTIMFRIGAPQRVMAAIYDPAGRLVRSLSPAQAFSPGMHSLYWDGRDGRGSRSPNGVYFVRVAGETVAQSRRIVVLGS